MSTKTSDIEVSPLSSDPRIVQAEARRDALRQRLEIVRRRAADSSIVTDDYVQRLMADPAAVLAPQADAAKAEAELRALRAAIDAAEADVQRIRDEIGYGRVVALRPQRSAAAAKLMAVLEDAIEIMETEIRLYCSLRAAGASATPFAYADDVAMIRRLMARARLSGVVED